MLQLHFLTSVPLLPWRICWICPLRRWRAMSRSWRISTQSTYMQMRRYATVWKGVDISMWETRKIAGFASGSRLVIWSSYLRGFTTGSLSTLGTMSRYVETWVSLSVSREEKLAWFASDINKDHTVVVKRYRVYFSVWVLVTFHSSSYILINQRSKYLPFKLSEPCHYLVLYLVMQGCN